MLFCYSNVCDSKRVQDISNYLIIFVFSTLLCLDSDQYILYAGRFIARDSELFSDPKMNKFLRNLMIAKKIDDLYIDLTTAYICEFNLGRQACDEIEGIIRNKYVFIRNSGNFSISNFDICVTFLYILH